MTNVEDILEDSTELYRAKNSDYGDSWRLVGETMALWLQHQDVDELSIPTDPEYLNALGLYYRRLDKMIRSFNGTFVNDSLNVDESVAETVGDQVPYSAMHTSLAMTLAGADEKLTEKQLVDD